MSYKVTPKGNEIRKDEDRRRNLGFSSSKGYTYTLEVLIAVSVIIVSITFLFKTPLQKPELELSTIKRQGFEALKYLDESDQLRNSTLNKNETELENALRGLLVSEYDVDICDPNATCLGTSIPKNQTIIIIDYYISGYKQDYNVKKIRLFLWRKF